MVCYIRFIYRLANVCEEDDVLDELSRICMRTHSCQHFQILVGNFRVHTAEKLVEQDVRLVNTHISFSASSEYMASNNGTEPANSYQRLAILIL